MVLYCDRSLSTSPTSVRNALLPFQGARLIASRQLQVQINSGLCLRSFSQEYTQRLSAEGVRTRAANCADGENDCLVEDSVIIRDDLDSLIQVLPPDVREPLVSHKNRANLLEVVLDLGRQPEARFLGLPGGEVLREAEVCWADLEAAEKAVGEFGSDNRAGVEGTLHRISAIRNRKGRIIGLTCRVGRAVSGHIEMIKDIIMDGRNSVLFLGRPGVGKTTVIREVARILADNHNRVVIVDTSNEIGGDGDIPHPAVGQARRMQVQDPSQQHKIMVEAVENHMPQVIIVDEIGTEAEAQACRTIAERGVQLIGTAHGQLLENLLKNPTLSDLVGGVESVTLGDDEARNRGTRKSILERKAPPTFPIVIEMRERNLYVSHWTADSVDALLNDRTPVVQVRHRPAGSTQVVIRQERYKTANDFSVEYGDVNPSPARPASRGSGVSQQASGSGTRGFLSDPESSTSTKPEDTSVGKEPDPYEWAQRLRGIHNEVGGLSSLDGDQSGSFSLNGTGTGRRNKRRST